MQCTATQSITAWQGNLARGTQASLKLELKNDVSSQNFLKNVKKNAGYSS